MTQFNTLHIGLEVHTRAQQIVFQEDVHAFYVPTERLQRLV